MGVIDRFVTAVQPLESHQHLARDTCSGSVNLEQILKFFVFLLRDMDLKFTQGGLEYGPWDVFDLEVFRNTKSLAYTVSGSISFSPQVFEEMESPV